MSLRWLLAAVHLLALGVGLGAVWARARALMGELDTTGLRRGEIVFQPMAPHCWGPGLQKLIPKMTAHMEKYAPPGADLKSWRY